jgi:hypothetical protein
MTSSRPNSILDSAVWFCYLGDTATPEFMHHRRFNIFVAAALATLFTVFNVGLPIVAYVCPMMASNRCTCACSPQSIEGPVITYVQMSCCNGSILAERNTVPFLDVVKYEPPHSEVMLVLSSSNHLAESISQHSFLPAGTDTGPPPTDTPLYLLSSSLLI